MTTIPESITEKSRQLLAKNHDILGHEIPPPPPPPETPEQISAGVLEIEAKALAAEARAARVIADAEASRIPVPPTEADTLRQFIAEAEADGRPVGRLKLKLAQITH